MFNRNTHVYENYPTLILLIIAVAIVFSIVSENAPIENPQLSGACFDSDGRDFTTSGQIRMGFDVYKDRCVDFTKAADYYCYGNTLFTTKTCDYTCYDGRCITYEQSKIFCGNGVTEHFEDCDYRNSDDPAVRSGSCKNDCTIFG